MNVVLDKGSYSVAWDDLGLYLGSHGRLEEAMAAFRQAVHLKPDYAMAWNNLSMVLHEARRYKEAAEAMRRFERLWNGEGKGSP